MQPPIQRAILILTLSLVITHLHAADTPEDIFWKSVQKSDVVEEYRLYVQQYPKGKYLSDAWRRIAQIEVTEKAAQAARQAETELRPGKVFKDCADCPEMVVIPAGSFEMGSNNGDSDEKPVHHVAIKSFAIGKTEVTQWQWRVVMGNNPSHFFSCGDDCPVEKVSWDDAKSFIQRLSAKTGKSYRLPSEAEWEYACRAGGTHTYCGSDSVDGVAWYWDNSGRKTHSVAGKQPNAWGLHDMSGNVREWTDSCWNGDCGRRVLRGGSWYFNPPNARAAYRNGDDSAYRFNYVGFRPARMLP